MPLTLIEAEHATAAALLDLHAALQAVANVVCNNEDELRAMLPVPFAAEAVQEILDALARWKQASEAFLKAVQVEQRARR